jgi:hypothetical protein
MIQKKKKKKPTGLSKVTKVKMTGYRNQDTGV